MRPAISVIIPVHNGAETIVEQLESVQVARQRVPSSEIVVVDNRSSDASSMIVRRWAQVHDIDVRVIEANERASEPYARNIGLLASTGECVAFCDADDRVEPTWLAGLYEQLEHGSYATGPIDMFSMNPTWIADVRGSSVTGHSKLGDEIPYAHGCNMGFRREALTGIGGFDERYTAGCDLDVAIRMWWAGHDLLYSEDAKVAYRLRPNIRATYLQGKFYGRYRVPIHARLENFGFTIPDRRVRRLLWLARKLPLATFGRATRARWSWVAGQLIGEYQGSTSAQIIDLTDPESLLLASET